ncbi:MAG: DNA mismatch repair endonuclease MutL [Candidatus Margulisiibacteriota bacterium]
MADRIKILDEVLASKIAAGEVVERPASVVKELVENSIDAGAFRIDIEIHNAGKSFIRVADNGCGMSQADALLSVERHATSKIKDIEDLFNISTLGFRGEALAAVSSVSRFELLTNDGERGTKISLEGGRMIEKKEFASPQGTTIAVKDLFFNTPARLKYLKSDPTESGQIADIVGKLILSNPGVAFKLSSNGREMLSSSGSGQLFDAVVAVYGSAFAKSLIEVSAKAVKGFIGKPSDTKINRNYQLFFINGRYVKNFMLSKAFEASYRNKIPGDRHPAAVLFIRVDPKEVDVNVHPAKKEVKFAFPNRVARLVEDAATEALVEISVPKLIYSPGTDFLPVPEKKYVSYAAVELQMPCEDLSGANPFVQKPQKNPGNISYGRESTGTSPVVAAVIENSYIVCVDGPDLVLIDQHAAHERVLYEKIKKTDTFHADSQICLVPEVLELDKKEFAAVESCLKEFSALGFDLEVFGKYSVRLKAVPSPLTCINMKGLVKDLALQMEEGEKNLRTEDHLDRIAKLAACHGAVKAGDRLSPEETKTLVRELFNSTDFSTCPHGRPTVVRIENSKLSKLFGR